jgi:hypothetical protein
MHPGYRQKSPSQQYMGTAVETVAVDTMIAVKRQSGLRDNFSAVSAVAVIGPIPGIVVSRGHTLSALACS